MTTLNCTCGGSLVVEGKGKACGREKRQLLRCPTCKQAWLHVEFVKELRENEIGGGRTRRRVGVFA